MGYDVAAGGGKLVINEHEAQQVRANFSLYLEHGALLPVLTEIEQRHWTTKRWTTKKGRLHPGRSFERNDLMRLLANVIYVRKVRHQGQMYPGEHTGIVQEGMWQGVQEALSKKQCSNLGRQPLAPTTSPPEVTHPWRRGYSPGPEQTNSPGESMAGGVPRIARLLALAIKFEGLLRHGVVKDYAELARLGHVSRARITQVMNLLNLAPDIQEEIIFTRNIPENLSIRETSVRRLSSEVSWSRQREQWKKGVRRKIGDE